MKKLFIYFTLILPCLMFANNNDSRLSPFKTSIVNCMFTYSFVNNNPLVIQYTFGPLTYYDDPIDVLIENVNTGDLITNFIHTNNGTSSRIIDLRNCSPNFPNLCSYFTKGTHLKVYITYNNCEKIIDLYL